MHHRRYSDGGASPNYVINKVEEIKDLGVIYDSLLLFDKHISEKVKAYMMLGIIKRNFEHILNTLLEIVL